MRYRIHTGRLLKGATAADATNVASGCGWAAFVLPSTAQV